MNGGNKSSRHFVPLEQDFEDLFFPSDEHDPGPSHDGRSRGRRLSKEERRKEGKKEGRKERRKEGRKEGTKE